MARTVIVKIGNRCGVWVRDCDVEWAIKQAIEKYLIENGYSDDPDIKTLEIEAEY